MNPTIETFDLARRRSVPFIAIQTPDQHALVRALCERIDVATPEGWRAQAITWDSASGLVGQNESGGAWIRKAQADLAGASGIDVASIAAEWASMPLQRALSLLGTLAPEACVIICNAHRWVGDALVANAIYRLREKIKAKGQTVVLIAPSLDLPSELRGDVVVIDDPLPDDEGLSTIIDELHAAAAESAKERGQTFRVDAAKRKRATDALRGLSAFAAEQVGALSMSNDGGIDPVEALRRKKTMIDATKGLEYVLGGPTFADVAGLRSAVEFGERVFEGEDAPRLVVLLDEMEKAIGGAQGHQSHEVTKDQLGKLLQEMEAWRADGMIAAGVPGSGKTLFAQALGNTYNVPLLRLDLGGLKGQYVGQSEQAIRDAMRTIYALSGGRVFFIGTVNRMESLPPELLRRFRFGVWMFDLPTEEERASLWSHYMKANGLDEPVPASEGWTGAEIRNACEFARRLKIKIADAMRYVVPISQSSADMIRALRETARGRYLSASYPGPYRMPGDPDPFAAEPAAPVVPKRRRFASN